MLETGNSISTKIDFNLIDETFDVSQSESYRLHIQTECNGLVFCIFNTVVSKYIVLRNYSFTVANNEELVAACTHIFANDDLLKLQYKAASHVLISPRNTLVPQDLFDASQLSTYLNFNQGEKARETVHRNLLLDTGLVNVFTYPEDLTLLLRQYHPSVALFHQATVLIAAVIDDTRHSVTVSVDHSYMDIAVTKNKKLLFYNTFKIDSPDDAVYYIAGVLMQHDMKVNDTTIAYAGDLTNPSPVIESIKRFVANVTECEPIKTVTYTHYINSALKAQFTILFNLYRCVS